MNFYKKNIIQSTESIQPFGCKTCWGSCEGGCAGSCDGKCLDGCKGACKTTCKGSSRLDTKSL